MPGGRGGGQRVNYYRIRLGTFQITLLERTKALKKCNMHVRNQYCDKCTVCPRSLVNFFIASCSIKQKTIIIFHVQIVLVEDQMNTLYIVYIAIGLSLDTQCTPMVLIIDGYPEIGAHV